MCMFQCPVHEVSLSLSVFFLFKLYASSGINPLKVLLRHECPIFIDRLTMRREKIEEGQ